MVRITANRAADGGFIGAREFAATDTVEAVIHWIAQQTGSAAAVITLDRAGSGQVRATLTNDGSRAVVPFLAPSPSAEVQVNVHTTPTTPHEASELIRALFRQGAQAGGPQQQQQQQVSPRRADPSLNDREHLPPEEQARLAAIDENLSVALEYSPEQFGRVQMLYVACEVNGIATTAFVDSGAQMSFMSSAAAERCDLARLIDNRPFFTGIASGVGEQKILGVIHMVPVNVKGLFMPFSFHILEKMPHDIIIGLDQLRRHQMILNLADGRLHIGDVSVPFLSEWEVAEADRKREEGKSAKQQQQQQQQQAVGQEGETVARTSADKPAAPSEPANPAPAPAPPAPPPPATESTQGREEPAQQGQQRVTLSQEEKDERIHQILSFTGLENTDDAEQLLIASDWDIEAAAALFFAEG